jgi:outer membrane biosynthesis protein TonB
MYEMQVPTQYGGVSTVHKTIGLNKKTDETARTMSRTTQEYAHTAMDYALKAQEVNTRILQRTSRAWIEGFRYQARLSQGMAQGFFGHRGNASESTTHVERPTREQSNSEATGPAVKDAQKETEEAAEAARQKAEKQKAEKQKAEKQRAEKQRAEKQRAEKQRAEKQRAEKQRAEKVARETRKAEEAAEETQEAAETAAKSAQKSAEPAAEETKKSTEVAAEDAQKNTETGAFPIDGYDEMNVGEVTSRLDGLSVDELKRVGEYEKDNKDRATLRKEMEQKIKTTS